MCEPHRDPVNGRDRCVARMLARHAGSLDIARTLATTGERFIAGLEVDADDPLHVVPACLLIRQISGLRSLCLLAVNGFYTEALGHQRSLMEALARITAIEKKPELIHDYLVQDVLNRKKLLGDVLSFRSDWGPETPLICPTTRSRRRSGRRRPTWTRSGTRTVATHARSRRSTGRRPAAWRTCCSADSSWRPRRCTSRRSRSLA